MKVPTAPKIIAYFGLVFHGYRRFTAKVLSLDERSVLHPVAMRLNQPSSQGEPKFPSIQGRYSDVQFMLGDLRDTATMIAFETSEKVQRTQSEGRYLYHLLQSFTQGVDSPRRLGGEQDSFVTLGIRAWLANLQQEVDTRLREFQIQPTVPTA